MLKISVVVPSYNQGQFLEETIVSILEQDYPNLEIFIIDGGSTDNSSEIIKKYSNKLTGFIIEKDKGQSDAINKGLLLCKGEIVTWLCSDDCYTKGTLKKVNDVFSALPSHIGVIHGNSEIFQGDKVITYDKGYGNWSIERQLAGMTFPQPSAFIRKNTLDRAGMINVSMHYGMDYDLFCRLRAISDFHYEDFFFSRYRLHSASKSTTAIAKFIDEWILIFNSIVKGLEITSILDFLSKYKLETEPDPVTRDFFSKFKSDLKLDNDKLLYYFLVNVIRYDYATEKFARVRQLGTFVKVEYGHYLKLEPSVMKIVNRSLILSPLILRLARKIKRTFVHE